MQYIRLCYFDPSSSGNSEVTPFAPEGHPVSQWDFSVTPSDEFLGHSTVNPRSSERSDTKSKKSLQVTCQYVGRFWP